jgi:hypothetical protein
VFSFVFQINMLIEDHQSSRKHVYFNSYRVSPLIYISSYFCVHYIVYLCASLNDGFYMLTLFSNDKYFKYTGRIMLKYFLCGISITPFLYLVTWLVRNREYPTSLVLVIILIIGHLFLVLTHSFKL